ncbi:YSC84-related protein [Rhodovibrionaceae bacterium A322]
MKFLSRFFIVLSLVALPLAGLSGAALADDRVALTGKSIAAEKSLKDRSTDVKELVEKAKAVLVFPEITKAGLIIGGTAGEGTLLQGDTALGHYKLANGSIGLTAGMSHYSQAILFMTDEALKKFQGASGWEIGGDLSVAVVDIGAGGQLDNKNIGKSVITMVWGQSGFMADASIKGGKLEKLP